jgi:integrase/recombinase XerC/integrase/recombinase XerD
LDDLIRKMLPALTGNQADRDALRLAAEWLKLDVANGDASEDTVRTYLTHLGQWIGWCRTNGVKPGGATRDDMKIYRQFLVQCGAKHATMALKLTTVRRFYQAAVERGYLETNPVAGIRPPRERRASDRIPHLSAGDAELLFRAIPAGVDIQSLRDRAILSLMVLEGLRRVEINRANVEDIESLDDVEECRMLVRGKGKEAYIYPRPDTLVAISEYIEQRGVVPADRQGAPLFCSVTKGHRTRGRITRIGINWVIDHYLKEIGAKREGLSCHALRHTCGHLLYQATRDVRVVQETLRHATPAMAAKYAHIEDRKRVRNTAAIAIKPER